MLPVSRQVSFSLAGRMGRRFARGFAAYFSFQKGGVFNIHRPSEDGALGRTLFSRGAAAEFPGLRSSRRRCPGLFSFATTGSSSGGPGATIALDIGLDCIYCVYMFLISQSDGRPMYLQIMEQIKRCIAVGDWAAGQAIPSIRQLAVDLGVSVITVKRAYLELERAGVIVTRQGKGCFVSSNSEVGTEIRERELAMQLEHAARSAALLGLSSRDLEKRIRDTYDRVADVEKEPV